MPKNPDKDCLGGDCEGEKKIYVTNGDATSVAAASFDPGYSLENTFNTGNTTFTMADVIRGYADSGVAIGEEGIRSYKHTAKKGPDGQNS